MEDEYIPTQPTRIVKSVHSSVGTTAYKIGSLTIPRDYVGLLTGYTFMFMGGSDSHARYFYTHHNHGGTLDWYWAENEYGSANLQGGMIKAEGYTIDTPLDVYQAGSLNVYVYNPGSAVDAKVAMKIELAQL